MKTTTIKYLAMALLALPAWTVAQTPVISSINKTTGSIGEIVTISGSGFSATASQNMVYFGPTFGEVISATSTLLEVAAPISAGHGNIRVINLQSGKIGYANKKYLPSFGGSGIDTQRFSERLELTEETGLFDVCACDFDGDGLVDIATTNNSAAASNTSVTIFKNATAANAHEITMQRVNDPALNISNAARNVICADLNGDGKPDLVVGRGGNTADRLYVFRNTSSAGVIKFASAVPLLLAREAITSSTRRIKIYDLDGDGRPEIIMTDQNDRKVHIFANRSTTTTLSFPDSEKVLLSTQEQTFGLDIADMDGDGKAEIIYSSNLRSNVYVARNISTPGNLEFENSVTIAASGNLANLVVADFNMDGKPDIAVTNFVNNIYTIVNNSTEGNLTFGAAQFVETSRLPWGIDAGDIDGDGRPDLIVCSTDAGEPITLLRNNSTSATISFQPYKIGLNESSRNLAIADFNRNGKPDLVYTIDQANKVAFLQNELCIVPVIKPAAPGPICAGQPVILTANQAPKTTYSWLNQANQVVNAENSHVFQTNTGGDYRIRITSATENCEQTSTAVTLVTGGTSLPPVPTISGPSTVCAGSNITWTTPTIAGASYEWTSPSGEVYSGASLTINANGTENAGRYQLVVLAGDGCRTAPVYKTLDISNVPVLEIATSQSDVFCDGTSNILSVNQLPGATYSWFNNNNPVSGTNSHELVVTNTGSYQVKVVDANGCEGSSNTLPVRKVSPIVASFEDVNDACLQQNIAFENTSTYDANEQMSYFWDFDGVNFSREKNPGFAFTQPGLFRVKLSVAYNRNTCLSTYEHDITVSASLGLSISVAEVSGSPASYTICKGDTVQLSVNADHGTFTWSTGSTDKIIKVAKGGKVSVESNNDTGCRSYDEIDIIEVPAAQIKVISADLRVDPGNSAQLGATGGLSYNWAPAETLDNATIPNPVATPENTTAYTVTGVDENGCTGTDVITVYVQERVNFPVEADKYLIAGTGPWIIQNIELFEGCAISIVDRNGFRVFESPTYQNDWEGKTDGKELPSGAYYYVLNCGKNSVLTGHITLIK